MISSTHTSRPGRSRSRFRRRVSGLLALAIALLSVGTLYTLFMPQPQTAQAQASQAQLRQGERIYNNACITCHGTNLQGVEGRGPSLIGVGEAAVFFQVSTGRMPLMREGQQAREKPVRFSPEQIDALGAFVQANGGGPTVRHLNLAGADIGVGGQLFRVNCASCHNFTGEGGALSSGKFAPAIDDISPEQIYAAISTGPQNMPKFSDRHLTPEDKRDIVAYIETLRNTGTDTNPGGWGLGNIGPTSEGFVAFVIGMGALVGIAVWIGARA